MTEAGWTGCGDCGMPCASSEYHPYAACLMFKHCRNSETVRANLQAVRQQGRVAGLRECLDMLEGEIARDRDSGVLESLRQRMEAKLEECK